MTSLRNQLNDRSVTILMDEAFMHIHKHMEEGYVLLAKKNSKLRSVSSANFICKGIIYPAIISNVSTTNNVPTPMPTLHYSLLEELDNVNNSLEKAGFHFIKNYFSAVLSHSYNGIVLKELLPSVLYNKLKIELPRENFNIINQEFLSQGIYEPKAVTIKNIAMIKNHYAETIITLRKVLMDKLLLQG